MKVTPTRFLVTARTLVGLATFGLAAAVVALSHPMQNQSPARLNFTPLQTPTGQYVTPTALRGVVQQFLNPGLPAYPDFVAGEAVRSQRPRIVDEAAQPLRFEFSVMSFESGRFYS